MEIKEITKEMYEELKKPLLPEAIKQHPTKTFLSSIKAIYVTERLNDVFGCGSWTLKTDHVITSDKSMVVVKAILEIPKYGVYYESFGGNDNGGENSKNFDLGDAFKGATTDAITKIGSYLGIAIDVFKGKNTSAPIQENKSNGLPWLNENDNNWKLLQEAINSGNKPTLKFIKGKYNISKATEEKIKSTFNIQ